MKKNGYTLMELLVTVAVVGVLAAVAIPSYKSYSVKTRRSEGRAFVMEIMQRQEKYYTENTDPRRPCPQSEKYQCRCTIKL